MLQVRAPQQVMLEVKVAEMSKTLLDTLGVTLSRSRGTAREAPLRLLSTSDFLNQLLGSASVDQGESLQQVVH